MVPAVWLALLAGLLEWGLHLFRQYALGQMALYSSHVVWMAPLAYSIVFSGLALLMVLPLSRWSGALTTAHCVFLLALLGAWGVLYVLKAELHWAARSVLSLGLAVQASRAFGRSPDRLHRFAKRTVGWLALGVALLTFAMLGGRAVGEWRAEVALPPPEADMPNVLLVILDTVRASSVSAYADVSVPDPELALNRFTTPTLKRWVQEHGVRFNWAIATSSWSLPSYASILTGRLPCETDADWNVPLDGRFPTLAEVLSANGYLTAGFIANYRYASRRVGMARGFTYYDEVMRRSWYRRLDRGASAGRLYLRPIVRKILRLRIPVFEDAATINDAFLDWLGRARDRPFFAFLSYMDAHRPYHPPEPFNTGFGAPPVKGFVERTQLRVSALVDRLVGKEGVRDRMDPDEVDVRRYHASIAYLDEEIGKLFDALEERGLLENTLVIVTSDHGEEFEEYGETDHGKNLYLQTALRVPLFLSFPGRVPAGIQVDQPVSLRNIAATVEGLTGISTVARMPGVSFDRYWGATRADPIEDLVLSELTSETTQRRMQSIVVEPYHYIRTDGRGEELYDYRSDPWERVNLVTEGPSRVTALRKTLDQVLEVCEQGVLPEILRAGAVARSAARGSYQN